MKRKFHWKHEISYAIIYWSITFFWFFLAMILSLEKATFHWKSLIFFLLFLVFIAFSRQQFIQFSEKSIQISYGFFRKKQLLFEQINQVIISENHLKIYYKSKVFEGLFSPKVMEELRPLLIKELAEKVNLEEQEVDERRD